MLLIGIGPLVVGILKATSAHSCPWDLIEYGGKAMSFPLFGAVPALPGPGRCFPGGHASSGFAVMALFFLFYPQRPRGTVVLVRRHCARHGDGLWPDHARRPFSYP